MIAHKNQTVIGAVCNSFLNKPLPPNGHHPFYIPGVRMEKMQQTGIVFRHQGQHMLAQTPLVRNLKNPEYMKILLNSKTTLEEVFADIEITQLRQELKDAQQNPEKIPTKIRSLIQDPHYPEKLANLLKKSDPRLKSNHILRQ